MTNNEIITELLKYDGFTKQIGTHAITYISGIDSEGYRTVIGNEFAQTYLTDMNILHRLAVKLVANISGMLENIDSLDFALAELNSRIVTTIFCDPNEQGEHIQLATALVNAIRYISANKAQ